MTRGASADIQRARIREAMVAVVYERGFAGTTVSSVCARAKVSSRGFYEAFESREQCFLAVLDEGHRQIGALVADAFERTERWQDGMRAALAGLLLFFDADPRLARVWLVESLCAGAWALERRERNIVVLTSQVLERWPAPAAVREHPLAAADVIASAMGVVQTHLIGARPRPSIALLEPIMGLTCAPYLDACALQLETRRAGALAREILSRYPRERRCAPDVVTEVPGALSDPRAHRARGCMLYVASHPGASNRQIADGVGMGPRHDQISRLLARLATMGLLAKRPGAPGHSNSWSVTEHGIQVSRALEAHAHREHRERAIRSIETVSLSRAVRVAIQ
ncbi:MAG TPA: TetR/AcrR family transcriptional regulator [Solirubrobacteraceae bacterium]|jgi:AcrR family transcriptional regulator|nr:TetR/AcrR family transcriptional regulator [Solirubrobacteraceae bacterium]